MQPEGRGPVGAEPEVFSRGTEKEAGRQKRDLVDKPKISQSTAFQRYRKIMWILRSNDY